MIFSILFCAFAFLPTVDVVQPEEMAILIDFLLLFGEERTGGLSSISHNDLGIYQNLESQFLSTNGIRPEYYDIFVQICNTLQASNPPALGEHRWTACETIAPSVHRASAVGYDPSSVWLHVGLSDLGAKMRPIDEYNNLKAMLQYISPYLITLDQHGLASIQSYCLQWSATGRNVWPSDVACKRIFQLYYVQAPPDSRDSIDLDDLLIDIARILKKLPRGAQRQSQVSDIVDKYMHNIVLVDERIALGQVLAYCAEILRTTKGTYAVYACKAIKDQAGGGLQIGQAGSSHNRV